MKRTIKISTPEKSFSLVENERIEERLLEITRKYCGLDDVKVNDLPVVYYAAEKGLNELLNELMARDLIRDEAEYAKALYVCVENGNVDGMKICYAYGGDPSEFSNYAATYCLRNHDKLDNAFNMFKFLCSHGTNINATPVLLQLAAYNGLCDYIKVLFENGQKPYFSIKSFPHADSALVLCAMKKENYEAAKVLIEEGCDVSEANYLPLKTAFEYYNHKVAELYLFNSNITKNAYEALKRYVMMLPCVTSFEQELFERYEKEVDIRR